MSAPEKTILILYASAGSGHKKAAQALEHAAKNVSGRVQTLDIVRFFPPLFAKLYVDGYIYLIKHMPKLWGVVYFLSDTPILSWFNVYLRKFSNRILCARLTNYIIKAAPDTIISTHFLASEITSYAKSKLKLKSKLITVVTDFGVHNFWLSEQTDTYCCATPLTKEILEKKGVSPDKIKVTGIPFDEKFLHTAERATLAKEFDINPDIFTALIITGGIGAGPIEEIVELIKDETQTLVVCGNNKTLLETISRKKYPRVRVFGFVDYVEKLMKVSDVVVTKAGGLTVTESLAMYRPMVFFFLIPGQEQINAETVCAQGAGIIAETPKEIKKTVSDFKNNPVMLRAYSEGARLLSRHDSVAEIIALA